MGHSFVVVPDGRQPACVLRSAVSHFSRISAIKTLMDEIAAASVQQSQMISLVETGIQEISSVVQSNSASAEKSAAVSEELSTQARTLNALISRFRIS